MAGDFYLAGTNGREGSTISSLKPRSAWPVAMHARTFSRLNLYPAWQLWPFHLVANDGTIIAGNATVGFPRLPVLKRHRGGERWERASSPSKRTDISGIAWVYRAGNFR